MAAASTTRSSLSFSENVETRRISREADNNTRQSLASLQSAGSLAAFDQGSEDDDDDDDDDEDWDFDDLPDDLDYTGKASNQEVDGEEELLKLEANLFKTHPKLQDCRRLIPDHDVEAALRARRNPTVSFNAKMVMALGRRSVERACDTVARKVPPSTIIVMGHRGHGGNIGVNGIYELYPDLFCHRPVYWKTLEKRELNEGTTPVAMQASLREFELHDKKSRFELERNKGKFIVRAPKKPTGPVSMQPARSAYFLFFDRGNGCWNIGPKVGHSEVFAKCPATEELLPDELHPNLWEVWNMGAHEWEEACIHTHRGSAPDWEPEY